MKSIKIAFGSVPKDGGTFTFYRNLRSVLLARGIDLRCVTVGCREARLVDESYVDAGCVLLAEDECGVKRQAMIFSDWCESENIDIVVAVNSVAMLSALPCLPKHIRVVSRCANAFDEGYRVAMSGRERLMRIVALTPRLRDDLVRDYSADPAMVELIPNGIDPEPFRKSEVGDRRSEVGDRMIRLGFLGRLEDNQKGVLWLPGIVRELKSRGVKFYLRIAGKGKHRAELERNLRPFIESGEVQLVGALSKSEVPEFLKSLDIYLFTSRFEGCPNALLEAMMAGAAPVAFMIEGITDFVLDNGRTGLLAPMGDCSRFAENVVRLCGDRKLLGQIRAAAAVDARSRFVPDVAAEKYADLFREVMEEALPKFEPRPWSKFEVDPVYKCDWSLRYIAGAVMRRIERFVQKGAR